MTSFFNEIEISSSCQFPRSFNYLVVTYVGAESPSTCIQIRPGLKV